MDTHEAVLRHLRFVACMLDVLTSKAIGFDLARLHLRLDCQRHFQ